MRSLFILALTVFSLGCCAAREPEAERAPAFEEILKIDVHAHIFEYIPGFAELLRSHNLRLLNICVPGSDPLQVKWMEEIAELLHQQYGSLHPFAGTFPLDGLFEPDFSARAISWLESKAWNHSSESWSVSYSPHSSSGSNRGSFQAGSRQLINWKR